MITAERAIRVLRRDLTIGTILKITTGMAIATAVLFAPAAGSGASLLLIILGVGIGMTVVSRGARTAAAAAAIDSPSLIAAGQFDEAEEQIERVLVTFWSLRSAKLLGLHHLAVLRHAQRRFGESAMLSGALLRLARPGPMGGWFLGRSGSRQPAWLPPGVARTTQLMLADSLIEMGDLPGAHLALGGLFAQQLSLAEAMNLLVIQLEYEARIGAWGSMLSNVGHKIQLAELLPSVPAARAQALLAMAAMRSGRPDLADWLRTRVALLVDVNELTAQRPMMNEVFAAAQDAPPRATVGGEGEVRDTEVSA
jgi:hypothetical protein